MIRVGIIAEDRSDVEVLAILLHKLTPKKKFTIRDFVGHGCGKIKGKCRSWASNLASRGCTILFLVHDLDCKDHETLHTELTKALTPSPIDRHVIVIPIEEIEAWLLSDPSALKTVFRLPKLPNCPSSPERIADPKGHLESLIWRTSLKRRDYVNTIHNVQIASKVDVRTLNRCNAFNKMAKFWLAEKK